MIPRNVASEVRAALGDTRVVLVQGARQVGKSTLATEVLRRDRKARMLTLDDPATLAAALGDPVDFVAGAGGTLFIDEIQRAPGLMLPIKAEVDRDPRPGRFLLTGSAQILLLPQLADTLAGRMEIVELWPFSQGEIGRRKDRFVDLLLQSNRDWPPADLSRRDYLDLAVRGGYPEAVSRTDPRRRSRWFDAYIATLVSRDIKELAEIDRLEDFRRVLTLIAARSGSLLNVENLGAAAAIPRTSMRRYIALLETAMIVARIPAWSGIRTARVVRSPKVFVRDSGLCAHLLGVGRGSSPTDELAGLLVETFAVMELARQIGWSDRRPSLSFLRTKDGLEVDAVLEAPDGRVAGVEIKLAATVRDRDFGGLRYLATRLGGRFAGGAVLYAGREPLPFGSGLWALPINSLWESG